MVEVGQRRLRVALLTKEYPPEIYGGAGVHVEHLSHELSQLMDVGVHCFGAPRQDPLVSSSYEPWAEIRGDGAGAALRVLSADLLMTADLGSVDLVHSHTWYTNFAGYLGKITYGIPHVMTVHSLEPLRPWKADQLGAGYRLSSWCERTAVTQADAVIAVSAAMREDVLAVYPDVDPERVRVIYNGIDPDEFHPDRGTEVIERYGISAKRPIVTFVGRVTRQKGIAHLVDAARSIDADAQIVFCAGAPDTPEIGNEMRARAAELARDRSGVFWIEDMLPRQELVQLVSNSTVFVCPSVYEPFGLINIEAMACAVPVVASAVGGIPEIVLDGETGYLVPLESDGGPFGTPADPPAFAAAIASRVNDLVADPSRAAAWGEAGRQRVLEMFTWKAVAAATAEVYEELAK